MSMDFTYQPSRSIPARISRRLTQWNVAEPIGKQPHRPIVSFSFDDFPKSAADVGAEIIESAGGRGTYFTCTSFAGKTTATGEQFTRDDIESLLKAGHEVAAHTHTHIDCSKADLLEVEADIELNLKHLADMGARQINTFAYPFGETRPALKRSLKNRFTAARGILGGINGQSSDRMQLRAFELSDESRTAERAANALKEAGETPGWVVIFTHGVSASHPAFGTTPEILKDLASMAQDIGAEILTVRDAIQRLDGSQNA